MPTQAAIPPGSALLVIDVQLGLDDPALGRRCNPGAEANMAKLLAAWRQAGWPLFHVQHHSRAATSPLRPDSPGVAIKPEVAPLPGEPLVVKRANSAFRDTGLEAMLREAGVAGVVLIGLTTEHCVSSTARAAADRGFEVWVVADATAAFERNGFDGRHYEAQTVHELALVHLQDEFATIITCATVLDWLKLQTGPVRQG